MVERRTGEIGLRMALGADRGRVVGMVLAGAFWQVSVGLGVGIPAAIGAGKLMAIQLFGVQPWDPVMLMIVTLLLGVGALVASMIPAWLAACVSRWRRYGPSDHHENPPFRPLCRIAPKP